MSSRYVPYGVYGVDDLDHNGDWRVVPTYGSVWMPRVAAGWAPYSTGAWVSDPYYGWTWVDAAPWGWAPFHYGRWVRVGGYWGWAPGPLVARPYYAPALVAFFDVPSVAFGVSFGHAATSWVALGWGEPCSPWWGSSGWRSHAHWMGWGGPRVVNNVVVNNTTIVNVNQVNRWSNAGHRGAVVGVSRDKFGRGRIQTQHFDPDKVAKFRPVRGELGEKPTAASFAPSTQRGRRPPQADLDRRVVATREPTHGRGFGFGRGQNQSEDQSQAPGRETRVFGRGDGSRPDSAARTAPAETPARLVPSQRRGSVESFKNRPPFGQSSTVRAAPPEPPRFGGPRGQGPGEHTEAVPASPAPAAETPRARPRGFGRSDSTPPRTASPLDSSRAAQPAAAPHPAPERARAERSRPAPQASPRKLPGEPANRIFQRPQSAPQPERRQVERPRLEPPRAEQPRAERQHTGRSQRSEQSQQADPGPTPQPQQQRSFNRGQR